MSNRSGKLIAAAALFLAACGPPWIVIKQANPDPFTGKKNFAVEPINFDGLQIGKKSEADYLAGKEQKAIDTHTGDKQGMTDKFVGSMIGHQGGLAITQSTAGAAAPADGFIVRPIVKWFEPGNFNGMFNIATEVKMNLQIVDSSNAVLDEIEIKAMIGADIYHPSVGQRLRNAAEALGARADSYLHSRTGTK